MVGGSSSISGSESTEMRAEGAGGGELRAGDDARCGGTLRPGGALREIPSLSEDPGRERGVSGSASSSVVTSKLSIGSVVVSMDISGSVGASYEIAGSEGRSECARARGGTEPGDTGGGTRDGRVGFDESRSMDDGGDSDLGESMPSLIIGIGLIESDAFSLGGGSGLERRGGGTGLGRGGRGDCRASGRTLGKRGLGGGLLRCDSAPSARRSASLGSSIAITPSAAGSAFRGVGTGSWSLSSLIDLGRA
jgi:hypothetical protein